MADDPVFPDYHLLALTGSIVVWCSRVESLLFSDLMTLQHHPAVKAAGTCKELQIATKRLVKQWRHAATLYADGAEQVLQEVKAIADEMLDLCDDRNVLVHGFWPYPNTSTGPAFKLTVLKPKPGASGHVMLQSFLVDAPQMRAIHDRAVRLYHRALPFSLNLGINLRAELAKASSDQQADDPCPPPPSPNPEAGSSPHDDGGSSPA